MTRPIKPRLTRCTSVVVAVLSGLVESHRCEAQGRPRKGGRVLCWNHAKARGLL
jgi:hypothetical protein